MYIRYSNNADVPGCVFCWWRWVVIWRTGWDVDRGFLIWCVLTRRHVLGAPDAPLATSLVSTSAPYTPPLSSGQFGKSKNRWSLKIVQVFKPDCSAGPRSRWSSVECIDSGDSVKKYCYDVVLCNSCNTRVTIRPSPSSHNLLYP
jgi:hypothetical protein